MVENPDQEMEDQLEPSTDDELEDDEQDSQEIGDPNILIPNDPNSPSLDQLQKPIIEPNYRSICRICQWSKQNVPLYNWLTERAVLKGQPYNHLTIELAKYVGEHYPDVKPLAKKSLWMHFRNHLPAKYAAKLEVSRSGYRSDERLTRLVPHEALIQRTMLNFDEYTELCELYLRFKAVHNKIYEQTQSIQADNPNNINDPWSQNKIQTFAAMINTQKSILSEISKMRQGDKLIALAARFVIEVFTRAIVGRLTTEFNALGTVMQKHLVDAQVMDAFQDITRRRLGEIILDEAEVTMDLTRDKFKIPS